MAKLKRKARFYEDELNVLVNNVEQRYQMLFSKFSDVVTNTAKAKAWEDITAKVNACAPCQRTSTEVRKKWDDIKSRTKQKATELKSDVTGTGGGKKTRPDLNPFERRIMGLLGESRVFGIKGGVDTEQLSDESDHLSDHDGADDQEYILPDGADDEQYLLLPDLPLRDIVEAAFWPPNESDSDDHEKTFQSLSDQKQKPLDPLTAHPSIIDTERERQDKPSSAGSRPSSSVGSKAKSVPPTANPSILDIERERLDVEKERLEIEKKRLVVEGRKAGVLEKILQVQEQRLKIK
ncbi:myb-related transcription factor, partner of profilin-like [Lineus longissimus]|uniref:myb-related transcription factor, partner of profilin-like n=1 Tax=Lineus longissimus TaxID=88925 RepID=UPI00315DDAA3